MKVVVGGNTNVKTGLLQKKKKKPTMSSAYWMSIKCYGDLFYIPQSLSHLKNVIKGVK